LFNAGREDTLTPHTSQFCVCALSNDSVLVYSVRVYVCVWAYMCVYDKIFTDTVICRFGVHTVKRVITCKVRHVSIKEENTLTGRTHTAWGYGLRSVKIY